MSQRIKGHRRVTLNRSAHSKREDKTVRKIYLWTKKGWWDVWQSLIIKSLKMYKISHEVINFIEKTMKTSRVELTVGGTSLAEAKVQRGIFKGNALSLWLFIIAMMPLNHALIKCTAGYKLSSLQEKINHLLYMDNMKKMNKNWKL